MPAGPEPADYATRQETDMKIAILGSGLMGAKLGRLWAICGHDVTFAYSRDRAKLDRLAKRPAAPRAPS